MRRQTTRALLKDLRLLRARFQDLETVCEQVKRERDDARQAIPRGMRFLSQELGVSDMPAPDGSYPHIMAEIERLQRRSKMLDGFIKAADQLLAKTWLMAPVAAYPLLVKNLLDLRDC